MSNVPRLLNVLRRTGRPPTVTGVVHNFSLGSWGHDIAVTAVQDGGLRIRAGCWVGTRPRAGDQVILRDGNGGTSRYRVLDVEPGRDVGDMYFLNLLFDPRTRARTGGTDAR